MRLRLTFVVVFLISACGLGYQLIAGSVSSYLLGDSVTQFSLTIGLYLFALGIGSYLTRYLDRDLADRFVAIELAVAVVGGFSALALMFAYGSALWFRPVLYTVILMVGTLVGIEIPLLMRILKDEVDFKDLLAKVLAFDYVGALLIAVVFPLALVPRLGLVRSALALGALNAAVALWSVSLFGSQIRRPVRLRLECGVVLVALVIGLAVGERLTRISEHRFYANEVVYAQTSPYQRVILTKSASDFQLFLSGSLQFHSADEYRYHEALVHPAMASAAHPLRVLVLGGGDGLAVREILRHESVERVTVVDLDPAVTELAKRPPVVGLNEGSLLDERVTVINEDAMAWLTGDVGLWDVAIVDFPDPHSFSIGKLYTRTFYERLAARLAPDGAIAVQSTNPRMAPNSYWCIVRTMEEAGWSVRPYHAAVPSFGVWGYALGTRRTVPIPDRVPEGCRFLTPEYLPTLFTLPADLAPRDVDTNRLNTQALVRYYEHELEQ
jgi:spermidine synthase